MKKILVPTDFSVNSKAGVRFAIHWAKRQKLELVFVHVLHILRDAGWPDAYFASYAAQEENLCRIKFEKFIAAIYRQMNVKPGKHSFLMLRGISADVSILEHCSKEKGIDYICISTKGAGKLARIYGTNTGNLITKSEVPVLAIPRNYRVADVKTVLYATDLHNYTAEIAKVVAFAQPLKAKIEAVHFTLPGEILFDKSSIEASVKKQFRYGLNLHFNEEDGVHSLIGNLQTQIKKLKPSVVVMFTEQKKTFFQKVFLSSKAETFSFEAKVPLLVFGKK